MRRLTVTAAVMTVIAAAAGYILRTIERQRGFEPLTNLPVRHSPSATIFVCYVVFVAALALAFAIYAYRTKLTFAPPGLSSKMGADDWAAYGVSALFAVVLIVASVMTDLDAAGAVRGRVEVLSVNMCRLAGVAVFLSSLRKKLKPDNWLWSICALIPELFYASWLIVMYHQNQTNPAVISYMPRVFGIAAITLAYYYEAGFKFGRKSPARLLFFHITAVFLCATALADPIPLQEKLIFAVTLAHLFVNLLRYATTVTIGGAEPVAELPDGGAADNPDSVST